MLREKRARFLAVPMLVLLAAAGAGVSRCPGPVQSRPVEELLLERQQQGLEGLIKAARAGRLLPFEEILVVVQEGLVQRLLEAALPFEQTIAGRYRIRVETVSVAFEDGFGLVQLGTRASLVEDPSSFAEVDVYGGLDIVELDPTTGVLKGRVKVLAIDTQRVDLRGITAPVRRLVDDLSREQLSAFEPLLSSVEIPVRLESEVTIPAVHDSGVHIESARLPVEVAIVDVKAFRGKLWVCASAKTQAKSPARSAP
jgi:hypothetical protein